MENKVYSFFTGEPIESVPIPVNDPFAKILIECLHQRRNQVANLIVCWSEHNDPTLKVGWSENIDEYSFDGMLGGLKRQFDETLSLKEFLIETTDEGNDPA